MPNEIEPDGQQFLDARGDAPDDDESVGETAPLDSKRSIALPVAVGIGGLIVVLGLVGLFVLGGGDGDEADLTDVATRGEVEVSERENSVVTTSTTEPEETTTTAPPTTEPTTTSAPPETVVVAPQTVIVPGQQPAPRPAPQVVQSCPGGSVATQMSGSSNVNGSLTASGTATSYFSTPMQISLTLVLSNGSQRTVTLRPNPIPANGNANWDFEATVGEDVTVTNLVGTFSFADPTYSHCPGGALG